MTGFEVIPETMIAGNVKPVNVDCVTNPCENSKFTPFPSTLSNEHSDNCNSEFRTQCTQFPTIRENVHFVSRAVDCE
jgi:hypothetical protein